MRFVRGKRGMAAAGEDSIIQKLKSAAAEGMRGGDGLSAERVQTVLRFVQGVLKDYERAHGTDNFLTPTSRRTCMNFILCGRANDLNIKRIREDGTHSSKETHFVLENCTYNSRRPNTWRVKIENTQ